MKKKKKCHSPTDYQVEVVETLTHFLSDSNELIHQRQQCDYSFIELYAYL